jgi:hypothetical protein
MNVSVIIHTYNRFKYLLCTLESIKTQDYDNSSEQDYYTFLVICLFNIKFFVNIFIILIYLYLNFLYIKHHPIQH